LHARKTELLTGDPAAARRRTAIIPSSSIDLHHDVRRSAAGPSFTIPSTSTATTSAEPAVHSRTDLFERAGIEAAGLLATKIGRDAVNQPACAAQLMSWTGCRGNFMADSSA
jgi:hypothetical protein